MRLYKILFVSILILVIGCGGGEKIIYVNSSISDFCSGNGIDIEYDIDGRATVTWWVDKHIDSLRIGGSFLVIEALCTTGIDTIGAQPMPSVPGKIWFQVRGLNKERFVEVWPIITVQAHTVFYDPGAGEPVKAEVVCSTDCLIWK